MKRFWDKVNKTDTCWNWTGAIRSKKTGYGCIKYQRKVIDTHIFVWFLTYGVWPEKWILHSCDNRLCVRPSHLFEGTPQDNALDAIKKGRMSPWEYKPGLGQTWARKRTYKEAEAMRKDSQKGLTYRQIQKKYDIGPARLNAILTYKTYIKPDIPL